MRARGRSGRSRAPLHVPALALALTLALPSGAPAADFGRWRVTVSGHVRDRWDSTATSPCAITGTGGADIDFSTPHAVVVHLRRKRIAKGQATWRLSNRALMTLHVSANVFANARRQPPAEEGASCSWPDPAGWACGPVDYDARQDLLAGPAGIGLADTHYFEFPPAAHEPSGQECGPGQTGAGTDLPVDGPAHGNSQAFYRLRRARVARRRRIVIDEHADAVATGSFDEQPPFEATDRRSRDTTIVLAPVR